MYPAVILTGVRFPWIWSNVDATKPCSLLHTYVLPHSQPGGVSRVQPPVHTYYICVLLDQLVTNQSKIVARGIMTNNAQFVLVVHTYKYVVINYFAAKTEVWMALLMHPVFGVTGGNLANKFAPSMGAIHYHMLLQATHTVLNVGHKKIRKYAQTIVEAMKVVNRFVESNYYN